MPSAPTPYRLEVRQGGEGDLTALNFTSGPTLEPVPCGTDFYVAVGAGMGVGVGSGSAQKAYNTLGPSMVSAIGFAVLSEPSVIAPSQRRKPASQLAVASIEEPRKYS